jgi:acyl-coenzyme A synthetase/AMP-(fatty) acid ligase
MTPYEALANMTVAVSMATAGRAAYRRLIKAAAEPREAQQRALTAILRALEKTAYGQQYGYNRLRTTDEFRRAVPIQDYEALRPYIDRQIETGQSVVTAEPPIMYARTSGTTGKPKLIPVTADSMRATTAAQRAMAYVQHTSAGLHPRLRR